MDLNKLKLLSGIAITKQPKVIIEKKVILVEQEDLDENMGNARKTIKRTVMNLVRKIIKMLDHEADTNVNRDMKVRYHTDARDYAAILDLVKGNHQEAAKKTWRSLDTASRDYIFDHSNKDQHKMLADFFGTTLVESTGSYNEETNALSWNDKENKPVNVMDDSMADIPSVWDKKQEPLTQVVPTKIEDQPYPNDFTDEDEPKINVPKAILDALQDEIKILDDATKRYDNYGNCGIVGDANYVKTASTALTELKSYLETGTVASIKRAQILYTSLMGPIIDRIPKDVQAFIVRGGKPRSIVNIFQDIKVQDINGNMTA